MDETARAIWDRLVGMTADDRDQWLESHELLIDGEWRRFVLADVERHPGTPLILYTTWPDGEHRVSMDTYVPIRAAR